MELPDDDEVEEEVELMCYEHQEQRQRRSQGQGRVQKQGDRDEITHKFIQPSNPTEKLNYNGKESHHAISNKIADVKGFRRNEGNQSLFTNRQHTSQRLNQMIIEQPSSAVHSTSDNKIVCSGNDASRGVSPGFFPPFTPLEAISPITCPGYPSITGKSSGNVRSSSSINPFRREQPINPHAADRCVSVMDHNLFGQDISVDETIEDCRVLSDEIAATLPSPVAVMFPFPSNSQNEDGVDMEIESKEPTEDSVDDRKMCQYINIMATSIAADILKLRQKKLMCMLEPSPLEILVRMPPAGTTPSPLNSLLPSLFLHQSLVMV